MLNETFFRDFQTPWHFCYQLGRLAFGARARNNMRALL